MNFTPWIVQVACFISPLGQGVDGEQRQTEGARPPAILHVSRNDPQLVPITSARPEASADPVAARPQLGREALPAATETQTAEPIRNAAPPRPADSDDSSQPVRISRNVAPTTRPRQSLISPRRPDATESSPRATNIVNDDVQPPQILFDPSPIGSGVRNHRPREVARRGPESRPNGRPATSRAPALRQDTRSAPQSTVRRFSNDEQAQRSQPQVFLAGENRFPVSQEKDFQVIVANPGTQAMTSVVLQLQHDAGLRVTVLDRAADVDATNQSILWRIDSIPAGEQVIIRFKALATRSGTLVHDLRAVSAEGQRTAARFSTVVLSR